MSKQKMSKLDRLQLVLDRDGANPSRWSADDGELLAFVNEDANAEQLFAQAEGLDRLLALLIAPKKSGVAKNTDLQDRILADFVNLHEDEKGVLVPFVRKKRSVASMHDAYQHWLVPTALAACFALGIYLGGYGVGDWTLDPATSLASLSNSANQLADITEIVMSSGLEEDLL